MQGGQVLCQLRARQGQGDGPGLKRGLSGLFHVFRPTKRGLFFFIFVI